MWGATYLLKTTILRKLTKEGIAIILLSTRILSYNGK